MEKRQWLEDGDLNDFQKEIKQAFTERDNYKKGFALFLKTYVGNHCENYCSESGWNSKTYTWECDKLPCGSSQCIQLHLDNAGGE